MLVLTRRVGESIDLDGVGRITITRVQGGRVRIGLDVDSGVNIRRTELPPVDQKEDGRDD